MSVLKTIGELRLDLFYFWNVCEGDEGKGLNTTG